MSAIQRFLARPVVNRLVTRTLRPFAKRLSKDTLHRIPVVGVVEVRATPSSEPVLMDNDGSDPVASLLFWRGLDGWEPATVSVFLRLLAPDCTVVDVGANTGLFSLLAARHEPTARVHAIEPVARVHGLLRANVDLNRMNGVSCHHLALAENSGRAPLYVPGDGVPLMASLIPSWCAAQHGEDVDCLTLDAFARSFCATPVAVVKIDAEGSEHAVVRGGREMLAEQRPFVICEVLRRMGDGEALGATMAELGYRSFALTRGGLQPCDRVVGGPDSDESHNYVFAHRDRLAEIDALVGAGAGA